MEYITGLNIYPEEKNITPVEYKDEELESKGWAPRLLREIYIHALPTRNQKVTISIKRRRWEVRKIGEIVSRNWKIVQEGTQMKKEFAINRGVFRSAL